ncbi:uncharacterized protein PEZ65_007323 [Lycodopsis pacificus]
MTDLWSRCSPPDKEVFHIPGLSPAMMQLIIEFAARPRLPNGILLAIGGWSGTDPTNSIESCYVSVAVLGECIYATGGFDGQSATGRRPASGVSSRPQGM